MTERKGNNSIKLIALNIVIALLITMLPISAGAEALAYTPEFNYQKSLIINGVEYDASKNCEGKNWKFYVSYNRSDTLVLNGAFLESVYANFNLSIRLTGRGRTNYICNNNGYGVYVAGSLYISTIYCEEEFYPKDESIYERPEGYFSGSEGYPAIFCSSTVSIEPFVTVIGNKTKAIEANKVESSGGDIYVGNSPADAKIGDYTNQPYVRTDLWELCYSITLDGNEGKNADNKNNYSFTYASASPVVLDLYQYSDTFSNGDKRLLGWHDSRGAFCKYGQYALFDKYYGTTTLTAYWESANNKAVILNNYYCSYYDSINHIMLDGETVTEAVSYGDTFTLPEPTRIGYKFDGWLTEDGELLPAGRVITVTDIVELTAQYSEQYEKYIIIDGQAYNALQSPSGNDWSSYYDSYNNVLRITLDNYNGGAIYSNVDLQIICSDSSAITGTEYGVYSTENVEISGCYHFFYRPNQMLIVRGGANHSAVFSGGVIRYGGNLTAIGDSAPALAATGEIKENYDWPFRTFVGTSVNDAAIGQYTDQSYLNTRLIEYRVEFNGNGGKDSAGNSSKTVIADGTPGWLYLYDYAKTFTNGSKLFLGWTDNGKWTGKYYRTDEEYYMNTGWINESGLSYSESLYAMWEDPTHKGVVLHNYHDEQHGGVDFHSNGDDVTRMVSKGGSFTLPDQVVGGYKFLGWRDDSSSKLYPAGTVITVTNSMSFTAEFKAQTITIDGEEYDATKDWGSRSKGWYYFAGGSRSQINVYSNYSGKPIYVNSDVRLILRGDVCGTSGIPAISIDGDLEIEANAEDLFDISVKGGTDAPAIKATGAIKIVVINSDRKVIVRSGGSDIPAIESTSLSLNYVYNDDSDVIAAGTDEDHLNLLPSYSNEPYVELYNGPFRIKRSGLIEAPAAPERSKYSFVGWREATNASVSSANNVWYMPGDTVEAGDGLELEACYVKNQEERAVIFDGQELRTASGSRYYVQFIPVEDAASFVMPECPFDLTSAVFTGYKAEDGSKVYLPGDSYDVQQAKVHRLYVQHLNAYKAKLADGVELRCIPDNKTIEIIISKDFCTENGVSFAVAASYYGAKAYKNALAAFDGENDLNLSFTYSGSDAPICRVFFLDSAFRPVCKNLTHEIVE